MVFYKFINILSITVRVVYNLPVSTGDAGLIPRLGRSPGEGNGNTQ